MGNASTVRSEEPPTRRPADNMTNAGPGWYYDPDDQAIYRYWDGHTWTDHRSDTVLSEVPS